MITTKEEFLEALKSVPCTWCLNPKLEIESVDEFATCVMLRMYDAGINTWMPESWPARNKYRIYDANDGIKSLIDPEVESLRKELLEACKLQEP